MNIAQPYKKCYPRTSSMFIFSCTGFNPSEFNTLCIINIINITNVIFVDVCILFVNWISFIVIVN